MSITLSEGFFQRTNKVFQPCSREGSRTPDLRIMGPVSWPLLYPAKKRAPAIGKEVANQNQNQLIGEKGLLR